MGITMFDRPAQCGVWIVRSKEKNTHKTRKRVFKIKSRVFKDTHVIIKKCPTSPLGITCYLYTQFEVPYHVPLPNYQICIQSCSSSSSFPSAYTVQNNLVDQTSFLFSPMIKTCYSTLCRQCPPRLLSSLPPLSIILSTHQYVPRVVLQFFRDGSHTTIAAQRTTVMGVLCT